MRTRIQRIMIRSSSIGTRLFQYEVARRAAENFMRCEVENARECDWDAAIILVSHRTTGLDDQEVHAQTGRLRRLREEARNERLSSYP